MTFITPFNAVSDINRVFLIFLFLAVAIIIVGDLFLLLPVFVRSICAFPLESAQIIEQIGRVYISY